MSTLPAATTGRPVALRPSRRRSEDRLLDALAEGSREAAERLVERSYRKIYAALHRMCGGDPELAADLTQETYRRAWSALDGFEGRSKFSTWLYRIAYTTYLNHIRRPRRLAPLDEEAAERVEDPHPDQETVTAARHQSDRLRRAVLDLPEDLRYTVTARFWGELSVADIARQEGITTVGIRKRLKRAYTLLEATLDEALPETLDATLDEELS